MTRSYLSPGLEKGENESQVMLLLCFIVRRPDSDGSAPFPEPVGSNQSLHIELLIRTMHMATLQWLTILGDLLLLNLLINFLVIGATPVVCMNNQQQLSARCNYNRTGALTP